MFTSNKPGSKPCLGATRRQAAFELQCGASNLLPPNRDSATKLPVTCFWRWARLLCLPGCLSPLAAFGQIDPVQRQLLQIGYNGAFEGHPPQSIYAFYYYNKPDFFHTNLTLRLALAPTYLDSELGISRILGEHTDLGIGVAGGGFADNYREIRRGKYLTDESFLGYGGEFSVSLYHLFNPGHQIPLNGIVRGIAHYSTYDEDDDTSNEFKLPHDHSTFSFRTGLRFGGREPTLFPSLAMELSLWYQGEFRSDQGVYGFNDRNLESHSHVFWGEAMLAYTMPELKHSFFVGLTAGTSVDADRFSSYRLGALLPLASEYPLPLPGYYYQEISARQFALLSGDYMIPFDKNQRWNLDFTAATAFVDYLNGLEQSGHWHSGVGAGILYKTPSFKVMLGYGYGIDAMRSHGRGAHSIGLLMQLDWGEAKAAFFSPTEPGLWRGLQQVFGLFGS
jgi:hypothetical protein